MNRSCPNRLSDTCLLCLLTHVHIKNSYVAVICTNVMLLNTFGKYQFYCYLLLPRSRGYNSLWQTEMLKEYVNVRMFKKFFRLTVSTFYQKFLRLTRRINVVLRASFYCIKIKNSLLNMCKVI